MISLTTNIIPYAKLQKNKEQDYLLKWSNLKR